ncbi:NAD(P)+ transhydrogenase beta chain [Shinella sp. G-2]|uniref:NAD(P)+ transhydrogenase beta chain n=1 Tax=Shinella sp. G-2 TaxID=3133141 RepID=UPI003CFC5F51
MTPRPSYRTTKRQIAFNTASAWIVILLVCAGAVSGVQQAVDIASIVVPSMVMLIAALLGIHRVTGSMDYRAAQEHAGEAADQPGAAA